MLAVRDAVSARPGCTKEDAVRAVDGYMPADGHYRPLDRALRAGLIVADWPGKERARLFATGAARRIWYLRRELLQPGLSPGRLKAIRAEIDDLQAVQARTWTDGPEPATDAR